MSVIIMASRRRLVLTDDEDDHPAAIDLVHPVVPLVSEQCRGSLHTHMLISSAAPPRVRIPDVIIIDDDDDTPIPPVVVPPSPALPYIDDHHLIPINPVVVPPSPALPLNIFQYAALFGHFPSVAAQHPQLQLSLLNRKHPVFSLTRKPCMAILPAPVRLAHQVLNSRGISWSSKSLLCGVRTAMY